MKELIGKQLGDYLIKEQIGKGGMASVFRATQLSLNRDVALKVLPPYYAQQDESFTERFKREAEAIAQLDDPHILQIYAHGQEGDYAYIVMKLVQGGTLKERMREPITLKEIYDLVAKIASALDHAHKQGVVHRDIKPSNIMLSRPDWPQLTDFGLAKMVGGSLLTQSGMTVGTPAYMSPEQGRGEKVDHRTDIYSLGVMLYEMTVGEVPYQAETPMAVVVKHIVDPLPIPKQRNPEIPDELQNIILKAMSKNPDDRYDSAMEMVEALKAVALSRPDWSVAEMKAVTNLRNIPQDHPETLALEDADDSPPASIPVEPLNLPRAKPIAEEADADTLLPASDLPADVPPSRAAEAGVQEQDPAPIKKKKRRRWIWLSVAGVFVCLGLVVGIGILNRVGNLEALSELGEALNDPGLTIEDQRVIYDEFEAEYPGLWEFFLTNQIEPLFEEAETDEHLREALETLQFAVDLNPDAPVGIYFPLQAAYHPEPEIAYYDLMDRMLELRNPDLTQEAVVTLEQDEFARERNGAIVHHTLGVLYGLMLEMDIPGEDLDGERHYNLTQAEQLYQDAVTADGRSKWDVLGLASVRFLLGEPLADRGLGGLRVFLERPNIKAAIDMRFLEEVGELLLMTGNCPAAEEAFRILQENNPDNPFYQDVIRDLGEFCKTP